MTSFGKLHGKYGPDARRTQYIRDHCSPEHPVLSALRELTWETGGEDSTMMSPSDEGILMCLLVRMTNTTRALDIGTFTGVSALSIALALPSDGVVITCDVETKYPDIGKPFWKQAGVDHKIDLRIKPALETLDELINNDMAGSFGFVFIDADKYNYDKYYEKSLILLRQGGVIAIDNTLWGGKVFSGDAEIAKTLVIRQLNEKVMKDKRVFAVLLGVADGVTILVKN